MFSHRHTLRRVHRDETGMVPEGRACQLKRNRNDPVHEDMEELELHTETVKVIGKILENIMCVGKRSERIRERGRDEMLVQQGKAVAQHEAHRRLLHHERVPRSTPGMTS